jgi:DNA invertase Pin-like site-specific DNA recombinase
MKKIGYLRVSTKKQRHDRQTHVMKRLCDKLFVETASAKNLNRPVYHKVIKLLDAGDELVILDIDRAYRNTRDALNEFHALSVRGVRMKIINSIHDPNTEEGYYEFIRENARAELERHKISRRTKEGLAAARAEGKILGRPRKLNDEQIEILRRQVQAEEDTITGLAKKHKVGRSTLSRALNRKEQ